MKYFIYLINIFVFVVLIVLQYLMFAFVPAVDPAEMNQGNEAFQVIIHNGIIVAVEAIFGIGILFLLNKRVFKINKKVNYLIVVIIVVSLAGIFILFANSYVEKFK